MNESMLIGGNKDNQELPPIVECPKCSNSIFTQGMVLAKISKLNPQNPSGQDAILPMPGPFICIECGNVLEQKDINSNSEDSIPNEENASGLVVIK